MPSIIPIDSTTKLATYFMPHQINWIQAEIPIHNQRRQAIAIAEKSVRIGWTYADAFKNVRKRLWFKDRDYLFATKDYPSALEYIRQCYKFAEIFNVTKTILSHGEEEMAVNQLDENGRPSGVIDQVKVGVIKFDNGSRILAFSSNPQAMAVYGGDVGLDEFAKHPNAKLLWETAQGRIALGHDLAIWSAHDGEDTLFNEFAREARAACDSGRLISTAPGFWHLPSNADLQSAVSQVCNLPAPHRPTEHEQNRPGLVTSSVPSLASFSESPSEIRVNPCPSVVENSSSSAAIETQNSKLKNPGNTNSPWNLYFRVTMPDAIDLGLVDVINRSRGTHLTPAQFLADCRSRARHEEIFQQTYMCNPVGATTAAIVDWSAIEHCRYDYEIKRVHLENDDIKKQFGEFNPSDEANRTYDIEHWLDRAFNQLFCSQSIRDKTKKVKNYRIGFDVAASGQGDLAAIYIDEEMSGDLWLAGLLTARTEDWHFLKTVLFRVLFQLRNARAAGDESGLGRQICWEAAARFGSRFKKVNFATHKHDLGFALMNQLSVAQKRFPRSQQDIASDFFALRKVHNGTRWNFTEGKNYLNTASHCDIAWAGALSTYAHTQNKGGIGCSVLMEDGSVLHSKDIPVGPSARPTQEEWERYMLNSNAPGLWKPLGR
jgi:phage FluMu gp28-like protein